MLKNSINQVSLCAVTILSVSSCASIAPDLIDSKLNAWQGQSINTVIQAWGLPTSEKEIQGVKYAEWNSREIKRQPSINLGVGGFGNRIFGSIGTTIFGGNKETHCLVQVGYNQEGVVTTSNWQGDPNTCDAAIPEKL